MVNVRSAILCLLPLAFAACHDVAGPSKASLEGQWQLVSLQQAGGPQVPAPGGATFSAEFAADGRLSLVADCNRCGSTYQASGTGLHVGAMACTRAYCATAPLDTRFAGLFTGTESWSIENEELQLRSAQGTLRLRR